MALHNRYNGFKRNEKRYNLEDLSAFLTESVGSSDARTQGVEKPLVDTILHVDSLTKSITSKVLTDSIRSNDWLTVNKTPQSNPWSD